MPFFFKRLRSRVRKFLGIGRSPKAHRNLKARFTYVYRTRAWQLSKSASGPGSDLDSGSVRQAFTALSTIIKERNIRSIADVPCGDFNWMPEFLKDHPEISYTGYDIVDDLISENRKRYPGVRFHILDITSQIPAPADLVFSKDMVNHLLGSDVWKAIANMIRSDATYLLITSNSDPIPNEDLPRNIGGMSRVLNLRIAPYDFPPPLYDDGYLVLWRTEDLAFVLDRDV